MNITNNKQPRAVVGRRDRPAKALLSRERIAETALRQLAEVGPAGLTLRKVAAALDTGPASLYVYIADADELRALTLDRALGAVALPSGSEEEWRTTLKTILRSYLDILYATPGLGQLVMAVIPVGENALRLYEAILGRLVEGGAHGAKAAWGVDLLTLYCAGIAAEQDLRRTRRETLAPVLHALSEANPAEYPHVSALREELMSGDGASRVEWALDALIDAVLRAPEPMIAAGEEAAS